MMKKTRLLVALLVMMFAASGFAQDSYREAVRDYLAAYDQFEKAKSMISNFSAMFEKNGPVDIDQLTNRFLEEQMENEMIDVTLPLLMAQNITEADLREVTSLISTPQGQAYITHQQDWMGEFLSEYMTMITGQFEDMDYEEEVQLQMPPVQLRTDIDAAYAAKFNDVIVESGQIEVMKDAMKKRLNADDLDAGPDHQEFVKEFTDWIDNYLGTFCLNTAYGKLSLEDMDYATLLFSNDAFSKLQHFDFDSEDFNAANSPVLKYMTWMEEQGAKVSEDPNVLMQLWKSVFNLEDVNLFDYNPDDFNLDDVILDE